MSETNVEILFRIARNTVASFPCDASALSAHASEEATRLAATAGPDKLVEEAMALALRRLIGLLEKIRRNELGYEQSLAVLTMMFFLDAVHDIISASERR